MSKDNGLVDPRLGKRIIAEVKLRRNEMRIERVVKAVLAKHKAIAINNLRSQHIVAGAPPDSFGLYSWDTSVNDQVLPEIGDVLGDIATGVFNFLDLPPETRGAILGQIDLSGQAQTFADRIKSIGADTAQQLNDELTVGIAKGEGIDKLTTRLTDTFDIADRTAATIARTETHGASESTAHTSAQAINAAGFEVTKEWMATGDDRTRQDHQDADEQVVGIDEPFTVGEDELMFPGDPDGDADQVVNCRCTALYDMPDQSGPDNSDTPDGSDTSDDQDVEG